MKKIIILSILASLLLVPVLTSAADGPIDGCTLSRNLDLAECPVSGECLFTDATYDCGICCLLNTLYSVTDWIFVVLIAVAGIFVVLGAMSMIMSSGEAEKIKKGREYIMYAFIGLILGFLARAIPSLARLVVGA